MGLPPQRGTLLWVKVLVPQTGKAVDGFCPGAVQGVCAQVPENNRVNIIAVSIDFIVRGSADF